MTGKFSERGAGNDVLAMGSDVRWSDGIRDGPNCCDSSDRRSYDVRSLGRRSDVRRMSSRNVRCGTDNAAGSGGSFRCCAGIHHATSRHREAGGMVGGFGHGYSDAGSDRGGLGQMRCLRRRVVWRQLRGSGSFSFVKNIGVKTWCSLVRRIQELPIRRNRRKSAENLTSSIWEARGNQRRVSALRA